MVGDMAKVSGGNIRKRRTMKRNMWCWIFMVPSVVLYVMFQGYPIAASMFYATLDWSGLSANAVYAGLGNFKELLADPLFFGAILNTFKYMLGVAPLLLVISLALAYILNSIIKKGAAFFRTVFFLPVITTTSIVGIIMMFIFGGTGALNQFLGLLNIQGRNWLGTKGTAMLVIIAVGCWKDVGTYMIYWLAALQSVPQDVYEAATIDGANKWQTFSKVVFPLILPIGGVIAALCVISSLKVFDLVQTMTNGGPFYATDVVATFVYRTAYASVNGMPRLGYASAAALVFGLLVILTGVVANSVKAVLNKAG